MGNINKIVITGTGAVAGAVARALVPAGYEVSTIGIDNGLAVFEKFAADWIFSPKVIEEILKGETKIDPFLDLSKFVSKIRHNRMDLSNLENENPFVKADAVILTAANAVPDQSETSAEKNFQIDKNSIDWAIDADAKLIVLTSSNWWTMAKLDDENISESEFIVPEMEAVPPRQSNYAKAKARSVEYFKEVSQNYKDRIFIYIDLCWYSRETMGAPISNIDARGLQFWVAECELQQHYLLVLDTANNPEYKKEIASGKNLFCFNVISKNIPPKDLDHPPFAYDVKNSAKLGVKHEFNVYDVLKSKTCDWRRIPIPAI